ncbi:MAG: FAD-dependent oxidoreductase [Thermoprotei archaeon]|nr:MAG: FAD-dependent oxidoreductase [Thermoprotei archaeon]
MRKFDVIIIGAGPAGLFAAYELVVKSEGKLRIAIIERGYRPSQRKCPILSRRENFEIAKCSRCRPCHVMQGVGGAGTLSSGTINLRPDVGGDLHKLVGSWRKAEELINYIDKVLVEFGAPQDRIFRASGKEVAELERLVAKAGAKFIPTPQRHIGTDNAPLVVEHMADFLENNGVRMILGTKAIDISKNGNSLSVKTTAGIFEVNYILLAPGRSGAAWFTRLAKRRGIETEPGPLDIGVRIEIPSYIAEPITSIIRDPKIVMYTKVYDDKVRTFCFNPNGFVVEERYEYGVVAVNGESYANFKSKNTNFALLVTVKLTDPLEDTIAYGKYIAGLATKLGGGKPLIQRLGDLEGGRRSTWERISRSSIEPTLKDVTPGDIGMALPYRITANIIEAISRLDMVMPGIASPQTLLYAPEIKFYSVKVKTNKYLETTLENVFAAGDGAGLSRGINVAAATGVIAARGILTKLGLF